MIVGYPGHFDVPRARRFAGGRPLVFDAVLSLENELVDVRRHFRDRSTAATVLRAVDFRALRLPNLVVCGTDAEARYLSQLGAKQTAAVFLGADEDVFCETWSPTYPFTALQIADASAAVVQRRGRARPRRPSGSPSRARSLRTDAGSRSRTRGSSSAAFTSRALSRPWSSRRLQPARR